MLRWVSKSLVRHGYHFQGNVTELCLPQYSDIEALTSSMAVIGDGGSKEVIKAKCCH